jgi:hypothetical protein
VIDDRVTRGEAGVREALQCLNHVAQSMPPGSDIYLPGVERVQVLRRGQRGWVRLLFYGYYADSWFAI